MGLFCSTKCKQHLFRMFRFCTWYTLILGFIRFLCSNESIGFTGKLYTLVNFICTVNCCITDKILKLWTIDKLECGSMPNVMAAHCPAKCMWQPLLNAVDQIAKSRRETRWTLLGCHKLANRSQPLVGRSSSYCERHVEKTLLLNKFFLQLSIHAFVAKI